MTIADELAKLGLETLRAHGGNANKAAAIFVRTLRKRNALLTELARDFLAKIVATAADGDYKIVDNHDHHVATAATSLRPRGRRREGKHRRLAGMPSQIQKAGALADVKAAAATIFARKIRGAGPIGKIHIHELRAITEAQARTAVDFLARGYDDAVEAYWCGKLSHYCVAADPFAKVEDVIKPSIAVQALQEAQVEAANWLRDGGRRLLSDLLTRVAQAPAIGASP